MKILLVDDDPGIRLLVHRALMTDHSLTMATNLADGQREYAAAKPELLISDGLLPDGNGARWLEEIHEKEGQRVLLITGTERSTTVPVLRKPFKITALRAKIAEVLGNADSPAPTTPP